MLGCQKTDGKIAVIEKFSRLPTACRYIVIMVTMNAIKLINLNLSQLFKSIFYDERDTSIEVVTSVKSKTFYDCFKISVTSRAIRY